VHYSHNGRNLYALGFRNGKDGFALRNRWTGKDGKVYQTKRNIGPAWFTTIEGKKSAAVNVFEGFFDFLSALDYYGLTVPNCTTIVLNSTTNFDAALPTLTKYPQVNAYFDNDTSGANTLGKLRASGLIVIDRSTLYSGFKDFNEFWAKNA